MVEKENQNRDNIISQMWENGKHMTQIAKKFGMSLQEVWGALKRLDKI